jgi:phosphoglycerate dehydrogenase-like enzyme
MKIAFHGINASVFEPGFVAALPFAVEAQVLTDAVGEVERSWLETADVIVGAALGERHPRPGAARLYQVVGAGYDAIDRSRLPEGCALCNVYGHEAPIAEYVTAALINRNVPFADADARLRRGDWTWLAGRPDNLREEWSGSRLGIVGYGRIGKEIARKAKAFDVVVHAANRSPIAGDRQVDRSWPLRELPAMCAEVDALVVTLPDSPETRGLVDAACRLRRRRDAGLQAKDAAELIEVDYEELPAVAGTKPRRSSRAARRSIPKPRTTSPSTGSTARRPRSRPRSPVPRTRPRSS